MAFGDVIRSAVAPDLLVNGIGGDNNTIWCCDSEAVDEVFELSTVDFSVVRVAASPGPNPLGIGGDVNTIWHCDAQADRIYELSTADFSTIRLAASPDIAPYGIGGDANTIWHSGSFDDETYELSIIDLSVVRSGANPSGGVLGTGGDANTIWHCATVSDLTYGLCLINFLADRVAVTPGDTPVGIGGTATVIWHSDSIADRVYELDASTTRPAVTTDPATGVDGTATLNGTFNMSGGMAGCLSDCGFEWGQTVAYGNTTPTDSKITGEVFSQLILGLLAGTLYHFRAFATNLVGTSYGADRTFTTSGIPIVVPTVTTNPATVILQEQATPNGTLDDDGGEACDCGFEWGLTIAYGNTTPTESKTTGQTFSQVVSGLSPGTTYHFRAFATNSAGTGYGDDRTFTTQELLRVNRAYALSREEL